MKRIFYNTVGEVVGVNYPNKKYLGGTFVDDTTKPIYVEIDDYDKPIIVDVEAELLDKSKIKRKVIKGYEKKQELSGYEKKELTIADCKIPDHLKEYSYITTTDDLPDHEYTNQMIIVDGAITVDTDKVKTVMPTKFIKAKEIAYQKSLIDLELSQENPDAVKLIQAQRAAEKVLTMTDVEVYELAKDNLARAEVQKPEIAAKLDEKINELKSK